MTRRKPLNVIRERVGRIFTTAQSGRRTRSKSSERPALQNFTFADSKIGSMMLAQLERDRAAKVLPLFADYFLIKNNFSEDGGLQSGGAAKRTTKMG